MNTKKGIWFLFILCFIKVSFLISQNEYNIWYFGNQAGLNFNTTPPTALTNSAMNAAEGCASISDANGNLLFYTQGVTVYNKNHVSMTNGGGLLGYFSSTQAALILPKPGSSTIYYIFCVGSVDAGGGLTYSEVDMTMSGGLGAVTANKNITVDNVSIEKLTAAKHANGTDYWVICHEDGNQNFKAFLLTSTGLNTTPVVSTVGTYTPASRGSDVVGYIKVSPNGTKLAAAWYTHYVAPNFVSTLELYDFDPATGVVSNAVLMPLRSPVLGVYGVEFSPDGTKLYASYSGQNAELYQYEVCLGSAAAIKASGVLIYTEPVLANQNGAVQTGPDGKIYLAHLNKGYLGVINSPNVKGLACNYVDSAVYLQGKISQMGFPNIIPSFFQPQKIKETINCLDVNFDTIATPLACGAQSCTINSFKWNFGDPASGVTNTSSITNPLHTYSDSGSYAVQLITSGTCGDDTITKKIHVSRCSFSVLSTGGTICKGSCKSLSTSISGGKPPYTYLWMPGNETAQSINACPTATQTYTVQITDSTGVSNSDTVNVFVSEPAYTITTTNATCSKNNGTALVTPSGTGTPYSYSWSTSPSKTVAQLTNLAQGSYTLKVTDVNGCTSTQSISISNTNGITSYNVVAVHVTCFGKNDGSLTIAATNGPKPYTYSWTLTPVQTTETATGLGPGVYTVTITDSIGCGVIAAAQINEPADFTFKGTATPATCNAADGGAQVNVAGGNSIYSYSWSTSPIQTNASATGISAGTYTVKVTDQKGCTKDTTFTVLNSNGVNILSDSVYSITCAGKNDGSISVQASGGTMPYNYSWSGMPAETTSTLSGLASGSYTLAITDQNNCSTTKVYSLADPLPISGSGSSINATCQGSVNGVASVLVAGGSSPYTYLWSNNSTTANITGLTQGIYTVLVADSKNCTQTYTTSVGVNIFNMVVSNDTTINVGSSATLVVSAQSSLGSIVWSPSLYLDCSTCAMPVASPDKNICYDVFVVDVNNCKDTATVCVYVEPPCGDMFIPTAFSPNGDGVNDVFKVRGKCIIDFQLQVFNRWGELVFETLDITKGWDGYYRGALENTAVFVFQVKGFDQVKNQRINLKGNVTLIR